MIISENYSQSTFSSLISYSNYDKLLFEWLETKKILVKPSTYNVYKNIITTHISKKLGHYKVEQITAACIETFALNLLKNGRIDGSDATLVLRAYGQLNSYGNCGMPALQRLAADVNSDGTIDGSDATIILKYFSYPLAGNDISFVDFINK